MLAFLLSIIYNERRKEEINMELTILMPCLNEEKTIAICIKKAQRFIKENNIDGEILIADNESTDNSVKIAQSLGARVINVSVKGYGSALRIGTQEAKGIYVIMGDSDDSYNFLELMPFIEKLREGYDLVMGNRYLGKMQKGAMKFLHKYVGTPVISFIGRKKYGLKVGDFNCGLRGYKNKAIINLKCTANGMEYASEMLIKAAESNLKIAEVPIDFYKDGRDRKPHLNPIRDGIKHLKVLFKQGENK